MRSEFLVVLNPIRLLGLKISCDLKRLRTADQFCILIRRRAYHMIVRFCYTVYLQLLNQHNQEFRPYIPDPLSCGAREGLGTRLESSYLLY